MSLTSILVITIFGDYQDIFRFEVTAYALSVAMLRRGTTEGRHKEGSYNDVISLSKNYEKSSVFAFSRRSFYTYLISRSIHNFNWIRAKRKRSACTAVMVHVFLQTT